MAYGTISTALGPGTGLCRHLASEVTATAFPHWLDVSLPCSRPPSPLQSPDNLHRERTVQRAKFNEVTMGTLSSPDKRIRGSAGVKLRKRRLQIFPICAECRKQGRVKATEVIDHIVPLAAGGEDDDSNCQGLCFDHHAEKTALESNSYAAANHPDWLEPSAIPLTIVCGPPASGKTTYVNERAGPFDTIICFDTILAGLAPAYKHWTGSLTSDLFNKAVRLRNSKLANLSRATSGRAWFIISAPTQAERDWWQQKLGGETLLLHPGADECKRRAKARGTVDAIKGVEDWEKRSKSPWIPPEARTPKPTIGADGWPIVHQ